MVSANSKIGIFMIRSHTFKQKIDNTRKIIKDKGYDLFFSSGVYYINQVFSQEGSETKDVIRKLLGDVMEAI